MNIGTSTLDSLEKYIIKPFKPGLQYSGGNEDIALAPTSAAQYADSKVNSADGVVTLTMTGTLLGTDSINFSRIVSSYQDVKLFPHCKYLI